MHGDNTAAYTTPTVGYVTAFSNLRSRRCKTCRPSTGIAERTIGSAFYTGRPMMMRMRLAHCSPLCQQLEALTTDHNHYSCAKFKGDFGNEDE